MVSLDEESSFAAANGASEGDVKTPLLKPERPQNAVKCRKIKSAIATADIVALRALALDKGGLLEDELRRRAWPILLGIDQDAPLEKPEDHQLCAHKYYEQVQLDVARSIKRFPPSIPSESRLNLQDKLVTVIMRVLVANPGFHYYQGYHDICVTVLLVVDGDEDLAFRIIDKVSRAKLHVYMEATMQSTVKQLELVYTLVGTQDGALREFLERSECGIMFCLSWCITWFGHDLDHYSSLIRLYDLFLATDDKPHLMPVYLSAALVLSHSKPVQLEECSMPSVHGYLSKVPNRIDCESDEFEVLVKRARTLAAEFPLERLEKEEAERRRMIERVRQWRQSLLGMTYIRFCSIPLSRRVVGALAIVAVAVAYQVYSRNKVPAITEQ